MCLRIERWRLCAHLVYYASQRPDVRVWPVLLRLADLRGHVKRGADISGCEVVGLKDLRKAEVAELDGVIVAEENWDC
jgi:hypothetical protein